MRVLLDTREKHFYQNSYVGDLVASLPDVEFRGFSWRALIFGRYDIFHVHWPEWLIKHGRKQLEIPMKLLLIIGLTRLRLSRKPLVRTMHNLHPHGGASKSAKLLLSVIDRVTSARVWLSRPDEVAMESPAHVVIPHPDYRPWSSRLGLHDAPPPGQLKGLCFGSLTPYRRFEVVAHAASELTSGHITIAGNPTDKSYTETLESITSTRPERLTLIQRRLDDAELGDLIRRNDVVFVPYEDLYNSGIIFLALTLQRPVALAAGPAAQQLALEYGDGWIRQWDGALDAAKLKRILGAPRPLGRAHSDVRMWSSVSKKHRELYEHVHRR